MSCGIDNTLELCIVPSDEEQLLGCSTELQEGANPARINEAAVGEDSVSPGSSFQPIQSPPAKAVETIPADGPTSFRSVPSDALHNLLLFCGPQSVTAGLGSTSKHYRSLCLTSGDSDAVWRIFCKWRCSSKLVFGNASRSTTRARSVTDQQEDDSDELMPSRATAERRREFQSSARLSSWNASSKSFENGKLSPDEPYYSIYRRLHLEGKSRENKNGVRCNRSRAGPFVPPFAAANPIAAVDNDPTLHEIEPGLVQELANFAAVIDPSGNGRLCHSDAVEWCDASSCRRARCRKCLGSQDPGARGNALPNRLTATYIGRIAAKCDYCAISLCKGMGGCAENNLRHCDTCNRGVCLDCEHIVSSDPLGAVRTCKGQSGNCGQYLCWRCARTVGRSKPAEIVSMDNIDDAERKMSPSEAPAMDSDPRDESPRRSPVNLSSTGKFEALPFASEKQYADATGQILCDGCATEKVGKLNLYRRLDMSPRI